MSVKITFKCKYQLKGDYDLYVMGNTKELGNLNENNAKAMILKKNNQWELTIETLLTSAFITYIYILYDCKHDNYKYEILEENIYKTFEGQKLITTDDEFSDITRDKNNLVNLRNLIIKGLSRATSRNPSRVQSAVHSRNPSTDRNSNKGGDKIPKSAADKEKKIEVIGRPPIPSKVKDSTSNLKNENKNEEVPKSNNKFIIPENLKDNINSEEQIISQGVEVLKEQRYDKPTQNPIDENKTDTIKHRVSTRTEIADRNTNDKSLDNAAVNLKPSNEINVTEIPRSQNIDKENVERPNQSLTIISIHNDKPEKMYENNMSKQYNNNLNNTEIDNQTDLQDKDDLLKNAPLKKEELALNKDNLNTVVDQQVEKKINNDNTLKVEEVLDKVDEANNKEEMPTFKNGNILFNKIRY